MASNWKKPGNTIFTNKTTPTVAVSPGTTWKKIKKKKESSPLAPKEELSTKVIIIGRDVFVTLYNFQENSPEQELNLPTLEEAPETGQTKLQFEEEKKEPKQNLTLKVLAKVDSGAFSSSISRELAVKLGLHEEEPEGTKKIKSASGTTHRKVFKVDMSIGTKRITTEVNIADRSALKYEMLLGRRDIAKFHALINVKKTEIKSKVADSAELDKKENNKFVKGFNEFVFENIDGSAVPTAFGAISYDYFKDRYDIRLLEVGSERLRVILEIKRLYEKNGFTWLDAKNLADKAPVNIVEGVSKEKADELKDTFEFLGANIEIR